MLLLIYYIKIFNKKCEFYNIKIKFDFNLERDQIGSR